MRQNIATVAVSLALGLGGTEVSAEKLLDKIKKGAETAGEAIGEGLDATGHAIESGAEAVGGVVEKGAEAVENTVTSTDELLSNEETADQTRARLDTMADEILARLLAENPEASRLYAQSAGYAVFDARKVTIFPVTTGYGRGVAMAKDGSGRVYMNMGTGGLGGAIGIGGFTNQFVILFESAEDLSTFVTHGYDAGASGGAQSGSDGDTEQTSFQDGRSVFLLDKNRWRVNASLEGTKYWRSPELN
ncbi:hypothetical protein J7413_00910 [Shimia sp. R10_1]|uniref:hypothetical protein n=1 Tax=Shimia sp. R10_1 TaxID=2821095 RepID=UPI001ADC17F3|nr:hypothetical protein [Shimia sp. R10_1]MBO9472088.1 hypothetical protein [Shimia sp. R10_1]